MPLFFDTETTGLWNFKAPISDPAQPRLVELGMILDDEERNIVSQISLFVKPEGFIIPGEASGIHGVTQARADKYGVPARTAIALFTNLSKLTDTIVAHNLEYDKKILGRELFLFNASFPEKRELCTMQVSTSICRIPGKMKGYKWPKLDEAYRIIVSPDGFEGAHTALADVMACRAVYYKLLDGGSFKEN
jgi:DNA polymerase III epsilon subunit-like protein